jgi:hypothetical protein
MSGSPGRLKPRSAEVALLGLDRDGGGSVCSTRHVHGAARRSSGLLAGSAQLLKLFESASAMY